MSMDECHFLIQCGAIQGISRNPQKPSCFFLQDCPLDKQIFDEAAQEERDVSTSQPPKKP